MRTPPVGCVSKVVLLLAIAVAMATAVAAQPVRRAGYDFTGDGSSDLLFRQGSSLGFWDFDGGVVRPVYLGSVDTAWAIVGAGDYDGNGTSDLLFRQATTGAIGYWSIVEGRMAAFVPVRWETGADWRVVSSRQRSDFNGDGRDDILWRRDNGDIGIYSLRSGAVADFDWVPLGTIDPAWQVLATGDFNGDGQADILWRHATSHAVGYWRMRGAVEAWVPLVASLDPAWQLQAVGDFDGDGDDDLYWRLAGTTVMEGYWPMQAGTIAGFVWTTVAFDSLTFSLSFASGDFSGAGHDDLMVAWRSIGPPGPPLPRAVSVFDFVAGIAQSPRPVGSESYWTLQ